MRSPSHLRRRLALAWSGLVLGVALPLGAAADDISIASLRAHATFLADDLLEGRDTGSRGYDIAARYAASLFEQVGLEPGNGESYLQPIRFARGERQSVRLSVHGGGRARRLVESDDFLISPEPSQVRIDLSAPVVFAGFGVEAPGLGHDDFGQLDVRGKILLVVSGAPARFETALRAHHSSYATKAETALRHGAVGVLTLRSRADDRRFPWKLRLQYADRPALRWRSPDGGLDDAFSRLELVASLSPAGAEKLLRAAGENLDQLLDAVETGTARPHSLGVTLIARATHRVSELTSPNVVALLRGSDPALADEIVVVSAHLDHLGRGRAVNGDEIYNGYYDNAMGSAIVLELARALATSSARPRRSVLFLLVTGEEKGLLGAEYFAHHPTVARESLVADVNIDMPLLLAPVADLVALGGEHSTLGDVAARAAAANGFHLSPDAHPEDVYFVRSDQYAFVRFGIPSLYLDTGTETLGGGDAAARAFEEFDRDHYHRPSDEAVLGTDWETARRFAATQLAMVREVADAASAPRWNPGDFFGETFGRPR